MRLIPMKAAAAYFLGCLLMVLVYTQSPLYSSNQYQYFLHGMAQAGCGSLNEDWLANTIEPTPLFTGLVKATLQIFHNPAWFYVIYALLMGLYLWSLIGILIKIFDIRRSKTIFITTLTMVLIAHSALLRFILGSALGANWMFLLDGGVAGQRLLGTVLQPSAFGVLLLTAVYLFISGKPIWSSALSALTACIHPTYLFSAALLVAGFMLQAWLQEKDFKKALLIGATALVIVAPILIFIFTNFWGIDGAEKAQSILAKIRIPHHALVSAWFDITTIIKILLVLAALYVIKNEKKIFIPLLLVFIGTMMLSLYQVQSGNLLLALMFPWRPSTLLMPIASSILVAQFSSWLHCRIIILDRRKSKIIEIICLSIIVLLCLTGVLRMKTTFEASKSIIQNDMQEWVRVNSADGERFLIPIDLETFRTTTLRPVYVDFFAIPYSNKDVINWYHRVLAANKFYDFGDCKELFHIKHDAGITHVVTRKVSDQPACRGMHVVYEDNYFIIYEIRQLRLPNISWLINMVI